MDIKSQLDSIFDEEELVKILKELIQRKSENPIGNEEQVAKYVQKILQENNINAQLSWAAANRPNVVAKLKGNKPGPTIIYNGHLDVVPAGLGWSIEPFQGIVKEGKMFGRGTSDMKSGVSAMIYAGILLQKMGNPFSGELILFFNVDEERTNLGMLKFFENKNVKADYVVIGEPTDTDICLGHRGCARFRLKTKGTPGHTSYVKKPDNAIYKMIRLVNVLEELSLDIRNRVDPFLGNASLTVSQINGGTAPNIVPDSCIIEIDRRLLPGESYEEVYQEIDKSLRKVSELNNFSYELECYLFLPASIIDKDHYLVTKLSDTIKNYRKDEFIIKPFEASCEAPFFSVNKGFPTIIFGPGSISQAHTIDEYVELQEVIDVAKIYVELVLQLSQS